MPLAGTLRRLAALVRGPRVTTRAESASCDVEKAGKRDGPQGCEARAGAADAEVFAFVESAHAARPPPKAGALLPNLQWPAVEMEQRLPRLSEVEPYRVWDVATSSFHAEQTAGVPGGHLCFVSQGHGRISLMLVGGVGDGPRHPSDAACEITILVRATEG